MFVSVKKSKDDDNVRIFVHSKVPRTHIYLARYASHNDFIHCTDIAVVVHCDAENILFTTPILPITMHQAYEQFALKMVNIFFFFLLTLVMSCQYGKCFPVIKTELEEIVFAVNS